jgi:ligand-binding sensor domain-containing protein/signal transduction histidine kinase
MIQNWRKYGWLLVGVAAVCLCSVARALDPAKTLAQYVHDRWDADRSFPGGGVFAIGQSQDGYLWIGTERGLVRFDGFDFTLIQRPIVGAPPVGAVRGLATDSAGNMWVRLDGPHLLLYRNGKFEDAYARFHLQEVAFTAMSVDNEGELLLWGPKTRFLRFRNEEFQRVVASEDIPGIVLSTAETRDRKLWMGTRDIGLFQIDNGLLINVSKKLAPASVNTLAPASAEGLWIGTDTGLVLWDGHGLVRPKSLSPMRQLQILALRRDQHGNTWVGTARGLLRITPALDVSLELIGHKPDYEVSAIFEDRDGDIWFGGSQGIQRLRDGTFTAYSTAQGLPSSNNGPVYVDSELRTWFAPLSGGLYWLKDGRVGQVSIAGLEKESIYSISGGDGEIWLGRQHGGLTVLTGTAGNLSARTYTEADGLAQESIYSVHRNRDGTVWAGTLSSGVSRLRRGVITNFSSKNGLGSNSIFSIVEGNDGTMWFATPNGLASFADGHWKNYASSDGLPSSNVRSIFEDSGHVLWIATSGGLAFFAAGRVQVPRNLTDSLREEILGITEDRQNFLWIVTSDHVLQVSRERLYGGSLNDSDVMNYGTEDGLPGVEGVRRDRSVVTDPGGRIWLSLVQGVATADPASDTANAVPVKVRIESTFAAGRQVNLVDSPELFAGAHSVTFNYAGSNLSVPQRVRFRYRLDGADQGWSDDVALRQVVYTNLGPGSYQFRIVASNGMGLWNGPETTIHFAVAPEFWQTWWFALACLVASCLAIMAVYRFRMYHLTSQLNVRFQERLSERSRIAQELHDTLLQGVLSASLQLDVAEDQLPLDSPAKPLLRRVLQLMAKVTEEGRNALRGLRAQETNDCRLEVAFLRMRDELAPDDTIGYRVIVTNDPREVRSLIRDEVYRIGREALVNAFVHAAAKNIEVEVEYAHACLRTLVRDDGCGIDPEVLHAGREGHWGLPGMRERSEGIGANLQLRSRIGGGTEIELVVPGEIAFDKRSNRVTSKWLPWLGREKFNSSVFNKERMKK